MNSSERRKGETEMTKLNELKVINVKFQGNFTSREVGRFIPRIGEVMTKERGSVVVDAADLKFIDCAGMKCFVHLRRQLSEKGLVLEFRGARGFAKEALELGGLI